MSSLMIKGRKTNHKKGIAAAAKARRRAEAEVRQAAYAKKPLSEKVLKAGPKELKKLAIIPF